MGHIFSSKNKVYPPMGIGNTNKVIPVLWFKITTQNLEDPEDIGKRKISYHPSHFDLVLII